MGGVGQAQDGDDGERPESVEHKKNETPTRAKLQRDSTIDVTVKVRYFSEQPQRIASVSRSLGNVRKWKRS